MIARVLCSIFTILFVFSFGPLSANSSVSSCSEACDFCKSLSHTKCKVKKGYVRLPERTQQYFIGYPDCEYAIETVPRAKLYYRAQGKFSKDKPTVVFVHGFGETGEIWQASQQELCKEYYTIAMDLRGFGKSSKTTPSPLPNGIHYTTDMYVEDIYEQLKELGIHDNIVLVGHSLGATYSIKYAATHQDQVAKLVLVGPFPFLTPDCAVDPDCATSCFNEATCEEGFCYPYGITQSTVNALFEPLVSCLANGGSEKECLAIEGAFMAPIWYNEPCQKKLKKAQAALVEAVVSNTPDIIFNFAANALSEDILLSLPDITAPTLICYGSIDIVDNPGNSQVIHDAVANSVLAEFVGKGHQLHVTDYTNFNRLLKEFIPSCQMADFIKIYDQGCCVDPLAKPTKRADHSSK